MSKTQTQATYSLYACGEHYILNDAGEIRRTDGQWEFSGQWRLFGLTQRWNARHVEVWTSLKARLDAGERSIEGYVHDIDHVTHRMWGGQWNGRIPKGRLMKL